MTEVGGHLPFAVEYSKSNRASCKGNQFKHSLNRSGHSERSDWVARMVTQIFMKNVRLSGFERMKSINLQTKNSERCSSNGPYDEISTSRWGRSKLVSFRLFLAKSKRMGIECWWNGKDKRCGRPTIRRPGEGGKSMQCHIRYQEKFQAFSQSFYHQGTDVSEVFIFCPGPVQDQSIFLRWSLIRRKNFETM